MKRLDRRLEQVEAVSHRRAKIAARIRYDVSDLTPYEQYELDTLLARSGVAFPHEQWALEPLTPGEQGRMEALVERVRIVEPGAR